MDIPISYETMMFLFTGLTIGLVAGWAMTMLYTLMWHDRKANTAKRAELEKMIATLESNTLERRISELEKKAGD